MFRNAIGRTLSSFFTAAALAGMMTSAPAQAEPSFAAGASYIRDTVPRTVGLQNPVTAGGVHLTENGLTARDYTLENSFDLAPADRILAMAIEEELKTMPEDQVLVILSGENHDIPSHKMAHAGVVAHLVQQRDARPDDLSCGFMVAQELPFNYLGAHWLTLGSELKYSLQDHDPDYRLAMMAEAASPQYIEAPRATLRFFQLLLRHNIPVIFNDTAKVENIPALVDRAAPSSPAVRKVQEMLPHYNGPISVMSVEGMAGRNTEMAERGMRAAKRKSVRVLFQQSGSDHIFGRRPDSKALNDSLAVLYRKAGARVLAYLKPVSYNDLNLNLDPDALREFPNTVIVRGMAENAFSYINPKSEEKHIALLARSYIGGKAPFDFEEPSPDYYTVWLKIADLIKKAAGKPTPTLR